MPIGPMALEVRLSAWCHAQTVCPCTKVRVTQSGFEESPRWRRYYDVAQSQWQHQLESLKALLEKAS